MFISRARMARRHPIHCAPWRDAVMRHFRVTRSRMHLAVLVARIAGCNSRAHVVSRIHQKRSPLGTVEVGAKLFAPQRDACEAI